MQIAPLSTSSGLPAKNAGAARVIDEPADGVAGAAQRERGDAAPAVPSAQLRRGLSNWDHQLQGEISSAQQTLDYLERSTSQLQALKSELAAKLAARQGREGQVEARLRQFSNTWRQRSNATGGTLDPQLNYSGAQPAAQNFGIRGLTMANLQSGGTEVLAFSVGGASQALRSATIEPGLSAEEISARFNQALTPSNVRVKLGADGELVFSTPEASWASVRDTLSVRGSGIRFPAGQLNRVKTDAEPAALAPETWSSSDTEALRATLQQVVQALGRLQKARDSVGMALSQVAQRVATVQPPQGGAGMVTLAQKFTSKAGESGYDSLLAITSALAGMSRERVLSLLRLR
ncbi:hypothetical protein [Janthinobacterium agaricidamnosum]|uniref:Uncharacterized protein n=1 Tax=Janthinobacterium agaricidamnosum NBRC 102515 = DSM 9628 TaxID=1349767 RepID=W0V5K8_9BURK|nr:hypothetical protein [Janthinobacterium agaricidamnosum]CDG82537.1 putative uncharacterized protein [Janthinobacterium agaricidamnosum NBRC 102515 = DSM 9628]